MCIFFYSLLVCSISYFFYYYIIVFRQSYTVIINVNLNLLIRYYYYCPSVCCFDLQSLIYNWLITVITKITWYWIDKVFSVVFCVLKITINTFLTWLSVPGYCFIKMRLVLHALGAKFDRKGITMVLCLSQFVVV